MLNALEGLPQGIYAHKIYRRKTVCGIYQIQSETPRTFINTFD